MGNIGGEGGGGAERTKIVAICNMLCNYFKGKELHINICTG